jgi:hypothetical protein
MMEQFNIEIGTPGIMNALRRYDTESAIAELVWNGFDAGARTVSIDYEANPLGGIDSLRISDDGTGIPRDHLEEKFKPFLHSNKVVNPDETHFGPSAKHGKNGMGRLTFFKFANRATWTTTYEASPGDRREYAIEIKAATLKTYAPTTEEKSKNSTGTSVELTGIFGLTDYGFGSIVDYLIQEFAWFIELGSPFHRSIVINGHRLDYKRFVGERSKFSLEVGGKTFDVRYVRWNNRLHSEYSRYYFIGSDDRERAKKHTTLNNKGDDFFHSVYVKSDYFDHLDGVTVLTDSDNGQEEQASLLPVGFERDETFKELLRQLVEYLLRKRSPFLRRRAVKFIEELESEGVFPDFSIDLWDQHRKRELEDVVRELYEADPRIFNGLNSQQKQTLVRLLSLIMDSSERDHLLDVMEQVVSLNKEERMDLARILQSSQLSNVIATIKMVEDRFTAVDELKKMVYLPEFNANERDHLQTHIERHYWLFGEQYHLVTAAEPDFEAALRRYVYILRGEDKKQHIDHPSREKEMDIFAVRWLPSLGCINNIVLELKHPSIILGKKELDQVKEYMDVVLHEPQFNASNMSWEFYLIGNDYNDHITGELESAEAHGQQHLVFKRAKYRIFVMKWSEVITNFELRHNFLLDRLKLERTKLATDEESADGILVRGDKNTASTTRLKEPLVSSR